MHTLQLLPGPERSSYAGAVVEVLEGLDGRLRVRHEGRIIAPQEAPPSPVFLRKGHGGSATPLASTSGANHLDQRWAAALKPLDSRAADEEDQVGITVSAPATSTPATVPPRKPTLLQKERGRQFKNPCARGCRCGRSRGIWGSTEPPSRNTRMPTVLRGGGPGRLSLRHHLIQWRHNRMTLLPNSCCGHLCWPSTPHWHVLSTPLTVLSTAALAVAWALYLFIGASSRTTFMVMSLAGAGIGAGAAASLA